MLIDANSSLPNSGWHQRSQLVCQEPKTLAAYSTALNYFLESCSKRSVEEIERKDLLKFSAFLRDEKELHPRTCWNKFSNVMRS